MTRAFTAGLAVAFIAGLLVFDLSTAELNPFKAPKAFALGSGTAASGGFCGALPN